jgi:hypothetical protein
MNGVPETTNSRVLWTLPFRPIDGCSIKIFTVLRIRFAILFAANGFSEVIYGCKDRKS